MRFAERPLLTIALGGHALCDPNNPSVTDERVRIQKLTETFRELTKSGFRLLIVHGNGPQVGRLMVDDLDLDDLDVRVAQTQGELGYLLADAIGEQAVALVTSVEVSSEPASSFKPIGPVLDTPPHEGRCVRHAKGWRRSVPSPIPIRVREAEPIRVMSEMCHVIAGGGGGVPVLASGEPVRAVIDKDYTATLLAIGLNAQALLFATNVDFVYTDFADRPSLPNPSLTTAQAAALLDSQDWPEGTMEPKLRAAINFVETLARPAHICDWTSIVPALQGQAGTILMPTGLCAR